MAKSKKKPKPVLEAPRFTAAQQQVIDHRTGPLLAGAVAGAGKTTTLVERVARLTASGLPLQRILLTAFNTDASEQLNRKIKKRLGLRGEDVEVARTLHSLTHSIWKSSPTSTGIRLDNGGGMYSRAIRQGAREIGVDIFEVDLVSKLASKCKNDLLLSSLVENLRTLGKTPEFLYEAAQEVVRAKRTSPTTPDQLLDLFFAAENARTQGTDLPDGSRVRFCGFDDLLSDAARLLTENAELCDMWQRRFDYVIVDEAQDLCEAQWRIIDTLAEVHRNLVAVGDVAQCIYRWRQAKPEHFLGFPAKWSARTVYMQENFRSGSDIVRAANVVLDKIPAAQKLPMKLVATRDLAGFVGYRETENPWTEARDIATNVLKHRAAGTAWKDQMVLVRTNDQSAPLELEMLRAKVPVRVVRGQSFFNSREAKTVLAYLRVIANRADHEDFAVAIVNPPKYLGKVYIDGVTRNVAAPAEGAEPVPIDWIDAMDAAPITQDRRYNANARDFMWKIREWRASLQKGATPLQMFMKICEKSGFERWAVEGGEVAPDNDTRLNFDRVTDFLSSFDTVDILLTTVDELKRSQRAAAASRDAVAISTVHSVKGGEAPVVYIAGLTKRLWPVQWGDLVDERRVFYVAVTRARDELWLNGYRFKDDTATEEVERSMYLSELGIEEPTQRIGPQVLAAGQMTLGQEAQ